MTVSVATFRADLPEFTSLSAYPDPGVTYWLTLAGLLLDPNRWGAGAAIAISPPSTVYDFGLEMFVAHNLVLERQAQKDAANGAVPGLNTGPVASKSVGSVSISYDASAGIELDAGHWNLTTYGTRFIKLARMMGAGGLQLFGCPGPFGSGGAWPGPWPYPLPGGVGFSS